MLLGTQPIIIAALVSWVSKDYALIMFFAYVATLWFGCSNAAQAIVKEIAIYRRERLVGVSAHSYLASKFIFLITLTALQALVLYTTVILCESKRDGSILLQLAALLGIAIAGVGIGSAISALSRSVMQAVMFVPLILIPQILFSGYTVASTDMSHSVLFVSRLTPTFCAQTVMDTSFLWQRELSGDLNSDHHQSYHIATSTPTARSPPATSSTKSAPPIPRPASSACLCGEHRHLSPRLVLAEKTRARLIQGGAPVHYALWCHAGLRAEGPSNMPAQGEARLERWPGVCAEKEIKP